MDVVVHGTKDGWNKLFKTNNPSYISIDIRNNSNNDRCLGRAGYSIAFAETGCIFSKFTIVRDSLRNKAIGHISFDLFISDNEKLANGGKDIKLILDQLSDEYIKKYVFDCKVNQGINDRVIREDWSYVDDILKKFQTTLVKNKYPRFVSGEKEAAYILLASESDVEKYFDKPYQEEYLSFKQVYFLNVKDESDLTNFLEVIRNSGIQLKDIDLHNDYYYLSGLEHSKPCKLFANDRLLSNDKYQHVIRAKDDLLLICDKEFFSFKPVSGKLSDTNSDIHKFLKLEGNKVSLAYEVIEREEYLVPEKKEIPVRFSTRKDKNVRDVSILCKSSRDKNKDLKSNQILVFKGEEIGESWAISAEKGKNYSSEERSFYPKNIYELEIYLDESKIVNFLGQIEGEKSPIPAKDLFIKIEQTNKSSQDGEIEFFENEIDNNYIVIARYKNKNGEFSGTIKFCPRDLDKVQIPLKKQNKPRYKISAGDFGVKVEGCPDFTYDKDGSDVTRFIKPHKGYKFKGFSLRPWQNNSEYAGQLVAKYEKRSWLSKPKIIASIVVGAILLLTSGIGGWYYYASNKKQSPTKNQITQYLEGDEFILSKLKEYESEWILQYPKAKKLSFFDNLFSKSQNLGIDSVELSNWSILKERIDSAIMIREKIDNVEFLDLKGFNFSRNQMEFKNLIDELDSTNLININNELTNRRNINSLLLHEITEIINETQKSTEIQIDSLDLNNETTISTNLITPNESTNKEQSRNRKTQEKQNTTPNDAITIQLKGDELSFNKLENLKANGVHLNSIEIYQNFWKLIQDQKRETQDYRKILDSVNKDPVLKDSELKKYLSQITKDEDAFNKYLEIPKPNSEELTIKELKR
ncbi:hypothetical protein [Mongoliitalea lutea]|uniref:Uncharacterized protein n=1 Tax=Mongoliitalea lutea TaxID=849756 RepID=A0A8J3G5H7_9BACT|nr:hypothetical protein [Mongoliitalea lutea]GHB36291.1 hypothetical protein GCM10008106_16970 [Mongoliitalea lutea]